ncbi:putative disease resistance protein RPP1 [Cardamine amara subsp. amara]|uniref:ADP-ribosyl cyclase/cyclic ADP-ribose hydrolase n=1 Tax=Cardamine amara subsp. amara TaxID=228776 RepID=A0ABD0ZK86_CARAN
MEEELQNGGSATPTKELAVVVAAAHEMEEDEPMVGPGPASCGKRKRPVLNSENSLPSAKRPLFTRLMNSSFSLGFFSLFRKFIFQQDNKDTNSLSLTSAPSSSLPQIWKHDVFPSFHGPDVRKNFLCHVLRVFRGMGINPFIDNDIERSKSIGPELVEAIRGSKIAIILLSKNYASSSWCLDELAEIMQCREVLGQIVMTIFYEVEPTNVRKQEGDFGKAFRRTCKGKTKEHIERWRKALEDVAKIAGEHSRNWVNEAAMIDKIATDVSNKLNNSTLSRDFDGLVGMRAHMERMGELLRLDLDEVRMIGIWGPPGIGKTTIARYLFNQVCSSFQHGTIMVNIKACYPTPCLDEYSAQLQLQNQMLSQVINHKGTMISHLGVAQERLKDKKVLLVLDDLDQLGQLNALAKETQWFGPGSRIIITTENLRVLNASGVNHIYKVNFPSSDEAFQIFCMNAFGQKHPDDGFYELAREVTNLAGELPLGLKVLGSALRGMSKQEWERRLPRLKTRLNGEIESIIKFSYDALEDEEKYLFLYIACLFSFEVPHKVEELLAKQIEGVRQSIDVLAEKSLISIDPYGIEMHTLLVKFGRETSREQFVHGRVKRQLLVGERDICEVLSGETTDSRRFIGINLDLSKIEEELNISEKAIERMSDLQFVSIYGPLESHDYNERLHSLLYHSQKMRSLHWESFQNICLPSNFNPDFLVELVMPNSCLQKLWEKSKSLGNLKWMDLSGSNYLRELPDLSTATNLEELILSYCSSLVELPDLSTATNLEELILSFCSSLVELPSSIGKLTSLQLLDLSGCSSLIELPSSIGNATNLQELNLSECSRLVKLPSSIGDITNLETLDLSHCSSLVKLPSSIGDITNLESLDLSNCSSLVELPSSIGDITNLESLDLSYCSSLVELPSSVGDITNLESLGLSYCSSLVELPSSIGNLQKLKDLRMFGCSSLVELPSSVGDITNLESLDLSYCSSLVELPSSIGNLQKLKDLRMFGCSSLVELPSSVGDITNLESLDLSYCSSLVELPSSVGDITNLEILDLYNCSSLVELPSSVGDITNLESLDLSYCSSLVELPSSIGNLQKLKALRIFGCSSLVELPSSVGDITNLGRLDLSYCSSLVELPSSIGGITNLESLPLSNCSSLVELPSSIGNLQKLKDLRMFGCSSLAELPSSVGDITNLESLDLSYCSSLVELPSSVGDITNLKSLRLSNCSSLVELPSSIGNLQKLYWLSLCGCSKLEALPTNINLKSLSWLDLTNYSQLKSFPEISTNIKDLILVGTAVKEVPLSIMSWSRLSELRMSYFESLKEFPHALDIITELYLNEEDIQEVPPWVKGMSRLYKLRLKDCNNLVSLPQFSDSLRCIEADNCKSLERLDCSFNHPDIRLHFTNCFKLNQEARDLIMHTSSGGYAILPGTEVPACFDYRATAGGPLTIKLNESSLPTTMKLKACIVLVMDKEETVYVDESMMLVKIDIMDKQNDLPVLCMPSYHDIYPMLSEHIYTFEFEAREVTSTELVFEFNTYDNNWKIGECGLYQILEVNEHDESFTDSIDG